MRVRVELVLLVREPQTTVSIKDLLTKFRKELFEYASTVDARPENEISTVMARPDSIVIRTLPAPTHQ